jgi:hypothetical protein
MLETEKLKPYKLQPDEKVTAVMSYTLNSVAWGEVVTKEAIRVGTWLRTQYAPQYITLYEAKLILTGGTLHTPFPFRELHVPTAQIVAFHLVPPAIESLDYDPKEPMRKMEATTALVGSFRLDGCIRMSTQTNLERYLDVTKETFTPIYEVDITQPTVSGLRPLHIPYVLVRRDMVIFSTRE